MSLLMEALKKAERAKQGQTVTPAEQPGQPGGAAKAPNSAAAQNLELSLLPQEGDAAYAGTPGASDFPPIITSLDTPSPIPDLAPLPTGDRNGAPTRIEPTVSVLEHAPIEPAPMTTPDIEPEPQPAARPETAPQDIGKIAAAQQKAKTVFASKRPARSRALLLTGAAAAVALGLGGFGIYYWQITSTGTMTIPAGAPQSAPANAGEPQQQGAPAAPAQGSTDEPVPNPAAAPAPTPASPPAAATMDDPARAEARSGAESFKENPAIRIRQSAATSQLNPTLGKAYQSFLSGDTGTAQQLYQKVLQQEPNNRDALLGMAAIALKHAQAGQAAAYYGKLLELDPTDPEALAALIGLQGQTDPAQSESRLKKILLQNPQADAAHFALGNLYSQQSRWPEAQQSYFRAYGISPGNADYAFNLAVSLDHLNQGKLALDYYQRALAQPGPANFDKSSVQARIRELMPLAGE